MGLDIKGERERPELQHRAQPWYGAYVAALFESDRLKIGPRIRTAERLIVSRERELFASLCNTAERRALHTAMHALRALGGCLKE